MFNFKNDYNTIGHPKLLQVLLDYANCENIGYGLDDITENLEKKVQKMLKENVSIYLLSGGTMTNLVVISKMLKDYEAIISVENGHINVHETGAIESTGHKIITVKGRNGKILPVEIEEVMNKHSDFHMVAPKAVYITNATEIGTIYTKDELSEIAKVCRKYDLYLYLDGARLANALASKSNDLTLRDIANYTDAFYLGGTKNGLPYGEMLIIKNKEINDSFKYHQKAKGGLFSKTFVLSYLFNEYLNDDFYLRLAKNANTMAEYLRNELKKIGLKEEYENDTNQIFIELQKEIVDKLENNFEFEVWSEKENRKMIRLVTSYHTDHIACESLVKEIANLKK